MRRCPRLWATLPREGWSEQCSIPGPTRGALGAPWGEEGSSGHPEDKRDTAAGLCSRVPMTRALCLGMGPGLIVHPDPWHRKEALPSLYSLEHRGPRRVSFPPCISVYPLCTGQDRAGQAEMYAGNRPRCTLQQHPGAWRRDVRNRAGGSRPRHAPPSPGPGGPQVPRSGSCDVRSNIVLSCVATSGRNEGGRAHGDVRGAPSGVRGRLWGGAQPEAWSGCCRTPEGE